ncbi:unnamed protein product [Owenia fusiformis]|uniref:Chitin-binding type-2 domain-containing protein n=1 Tax=Owenia fusiformis TaxID=6347 RepID=A0A8S4NG56_OWEFU|nr:unnamed protein product [Owenia fusiformis]
MVNVVMMLLQVLTVDVNDENGLLDFEFDVQAFCEVACDQFNGGYFPYPGDCCRFIICQRLPASRGRGKVLSSVMPCQLPLVWNDEKASCDLEKRTPNCNASCHERAFTLPPATLPPMNDSVECFDGVNAIKLDDLVDQQCFKIFPYDERQMPTCCRENEILDLEECACIGQPRFPGCDCIFCLVFELNEIRDVVNTLHINHTGVELIEYAINASMHKAQFNGIDGSIKIPHFENMYYGPIFSMHLFIEIPNKYEVSGFVDAPLKGIVSNGCCGKNGTVEIWIEGGHIYLTIITEKRALRAYKFNVDPEELIAGQELDLNFAYSDPLLRVAFAMEPHEDIALGGDIVPTGCPLSLGTLNDLPGTYFDGVMEDVIACRDRWTDAQIFALQQHDKRAVLCTP